MADLNSIGGLHYEMMRRCYNEKSVAYKDYGAKGIRVCEEWHDRENFRKWCKDNGYVKGLRINRIDSKKDYCPENCVLGEKNKRSSGIGKHAREIRNHRKEMKEYAGIKDNYSKERIYKIYNGMKARCYIKSTSHYENYGGRGITVCNEWLGRDGFFAFYKWAIDNGYSDELTIDRIDNDKGYAPENCRWVTWQEQASNKRTSIKVIYQGKEKSLACLARELGIEYSVLHNEYRKKKRGKNVWIIDELTVSKL